MKAQFKIKRKKNAIKSMKKLLMVMPLLLLGWAEIYLTSFSLLVKSLLLKKKKFRHSEQILLYNALVKEKWLR